MLVAGASSTTVTSQPSARSRRATDRPVSANPMTRTRIKSSLQAEPEEVGVEDADAERDADAGEQPEAHDHRELRPAADLEMMMNRRHAQHTAPEPAVRHDLGDHRERLDQRQAGQNRQQQMSARHQRE